VAVASCQLSVASCPHGSKRWQTVRMSPLLMRKYDYTELIAWQRPIDLVASVYDVSRTFSADERYGLTAQMRRAAVSVSANIAEGQGRRSRGQFLNQLSVAQGSLCELETHVVIAERIALLERTAARELLDRTAEVGRLITGLA